MKKVEKITLTRGPYSMKELKNEQILRDLGRMLKGERRRQKFTQKELADLLGFSRETILKLENHSSDVKLSALLKIADFLGLDFLIQKREQ